MSAFEELPLMSLYFELAPPLIVGAGEGVGVPEARCACWYSCSTSPS